MLVFKKHRKGLRSVSIVSDVLLNAQKCVSARSANPAHCTLSFEEANLRLAAATVIAFDDGLYFGLPKLAGAVTTPVQNCTKSLRTFWDCWEANWTGAALALQLSLSGSSPVRASLQSGVRARITRRRREALTQSSLARMTCITLSFTPKNKKKIPDHWD